MMRSILIFFAAVALASACVPKEAVVLRQIKSLNLEADLSGQPVLKGEAILFNPNKVNMKLKGINVDVYIDEKKSAHAEQDYDLPIPASSEFSIPLEVKLTLEKQNLLNTFFDVLGGKKYAVHYKGFVRVHVHGVTVRVPIDYTDQIRLTI
jgi:LEA14-like dessication related protein